mmetsp:Transcript_17562/g.21854  ORF Transcript_17562/g.21854 Transcript_17562/m.21854 type:complete len:88 (-) Transcript_17562:122-385(-)
MQAKDVNARPMEGSSRPNDFLRRAGKKAKKVESPTLNRNDTTQTDATPVQRRVPRGQDIISSLSSDTSDSFSPNLPTPFFVVVGATP